MNTQQHHILLVDDDVALCELLAEYLCADGFLVDQAHSGPKAIDKVSASHLDPSAAPYHAMVLDIMMPGMSGLEVLKNLRQSDNLPVLMLTGRGDEIDRIIGLEMGADDYIGKPCNPRELSARLKAVIRRTAAFNANHERNHPSALPTLHGIELNPGNRTVHFQNSELTLTGAEFNVLHLLMQTPGRPMSKSELTQQVLQRKLTLHDRSIDVHVSRIRQKLIQAGCPQDLIQTVRGIGYQMIVETENFS